MGKVPTIKDGDVVVSEVAAICCYLADAYPKAKLGAADRGQARGPISSGCSMDRAASSRR